MFLNLLLLQSKKKARDGHLGFNAAHGKPEDKYAVVNGIATDDALDGHFVLRKCELRKAKWDKYRYIPGVFPNKVAAGNDLSTHGMSRRKKLAKGLESTHSAGHYEAGVQRKSGPARKLDELFGGAGNTDEAEDSNPLNRSGRSIFGLPLLSPLTSWYRTWATLILLLDMTYVAFIVPIIIGFEVNDFNWTSWACCVDFAAGTLYALELFINFQVGFIGTYKHQRRLIMDGRGVARFYAVHGSMFVDFLTFVAYIAQVALIIVVGTGRTLPDSTTIVYHVVRVLRLIRFASLLTRLYNAALALTKFLLPGVAINYHHAYFFNLVYGGCILFNFMACVWTFVSIEEGYDNTWINYFQPLVRLYAAPNDTSPPTTLAPEEAAAVPGGVRYITALYYVVVTVLTIGYGDISARTVPEMIVAVITMVIGIVFFGILLSSVSDVLQNMGKDAKTKAESRKRLEGVEEWMRERTLPKSLRNRIGAFYQEDWIRDSEAQEEVKILTELPQLLRKDVALELNRKYFQRTGLFRGFPEPVLAQITAVMQVVQVPAGVDFCEAGEYADCVWFLHEGHVSTVAADGKPLPGMFKPPAVLGETAVLAEAEPQFSLRTVTHRTLSTSLIWELETKDLFPILQRYPELYTRARIQAQPRAMGKPYYLPPEEAAQPDDENGENAEDPNIQDSISSKASARGKPFGGMPPVGAMRPSNGDTLGAAERADLRSQLSQLSSQKSYTSLTRKYSASGNALLGTPRRSTMQ